MKTKIHYFLNRSSIGSLLITALIIVSIIGFFLETEYHESKNLKLFGASIAALFAVEYLARIWTSDLNQGRPGIKAYVFSVGGIIDLLAFLPALLIPAANGSVTLRLLRILRLLQLLKIKPVTVGIQRVLRALRESWNELLACLIISIMLLVFGGVLMYFAEGSAQPESFGSVPRALWWAVATLTTVGYGDVYPVTAMGKIIASFLAILGVASVGMPAGILAAAFKKVGVDG